MRVSPVSHQCVRVLEHLMTDIRMQIETSDNGNLISDKFTNPLQEFTFTVVYMFHNHRPMDVEIYCIGSFLLKRICDLPHNPLKCIFGDFTRRRS